MKEKYSKAIEAIIAFKNIFDNIDPRVPKRLVGDIGEFYALQKLEDFGLNPERKGGRSKYDIYLPKVNKKLEIRTSLLFSDVKVFPKKEIRFWGWRVAYWDEKIPKKFDYLICIALDDKFINPSFYIFTYDEAFSVDDVKMERFPNVKKKIFLFENEASYKKALELRPELVTPFEIEINRGPICFLNNWSKIK